VYWPLRHKDVLSSNLHYLVLRSVEEHSELEVRTPQVVWVPGLYPLAPELQVWVFSARCHNGASLHHGLHAKRRGGGK
jgi:hypothetical protein